MLLDGQQRLTFLFSIIKGEPVEVRGRKSPIEILFNLEHPEKLTRATEIDGELEEDNDENGEEEDLETPENDLLNKWLLLSKTNEFNKIQNGFPLVSFLRKNQDNGCFTK